MSHRGSKTGNFSARVSHTQSPTTIIAHLKAKWSFLEELLDKNEKYLENLRDQIDRLEDRLEYTYSIQKKKEINIWIEEKDYKIASVLEKNEGIRIEIEAIKNKIIYYTKR